MSASDVTNSASDLNSPEPAADWLRIIGGVGFEPRAIPFEQSELGPGSELFLGLKPK